MTSTVDPSVIKLEQFSSSLAMNDASLQHFKAILNIYIYIYANSVAVDIKLQDECSGGMWVILYHTQVGEGEG